MSLQQLCFLKFERPLIDLLGAEFFRAAPRQPGVYLFFGERRRVLYVGQSKNLRLRLSYYKNARPEREPRRIIRLVHQTRAIEWTTCESAAQAQAREVELIQEHRPKFNVQHALSPTYTFFGVRHESGRLQLRVTLDQNPRPGETLVGALKNRGLCRRAFFAMGRALWTLTRAPQNLFDLPMWLLDRSKLNEILLEASESAVSQVMTLIRGDAGDFCKQVEAAANQANDRFLQMLFQQDFIALTEFLELAVRMRKLREHSGVGEVLPQTQVDRVRFTNAIVP